MSKKVILKLQLLDEEAEKNAVEEVRGLQGFNEFYKDMKYENKEKDQKWIVIGDINPVDLAIKLKKFCSITPELVTVETEQEPENSSKEKKAVPEKGQEPKKDEKQKETKKEETEEKEEQAKKDERAKKDEKQKETKNEEPEVKEERTKKNERPKNDDVAKLVSAYKAYNPYKSE